MIYIDNHKESFNYEGNIEELLNKVIDFALSCEGIDFEYEVSVVLVDNNEIREINNQMRNIDKETDVLSFPMLDYPEGEVFKEVYSDKEFDDSYFDGDNLVLGDIVLSLEKCTEQSEEFDHSFERECAYLTVHSVLHLLGYDHMIEEDKVRMRKREEEILNKLNIIRD